MSTAWRTAFYDLHQAGTFLMPNPFDLGSARLLSALGFPALATTSGGLAASLGRPDMTVGRDRLVEHVTAMCATTDLPVNVDAEQCFPESPGGVAATVELLADAGAAGCSIEDWNPHAGHIEDLDVATERVALAASVAQRQGLVLTARAENHLHGHDDLDDTVRRLTTYRRAGADVVYAPGLIDLGAISRLVEETGAPLNVLLIPGGPSREQLAGIGVRRLSVGSLLAHIAYGSLAQAAEHLLAEGALPADAPYIDWALSHRAFSADN
jgi:2-methylisocitrate lyase-like PEP mutase family enzyme